MPRVPQVMLTLNPEGLIVAEFPTTNGLRRGVEIANGEAGMDTIRRILSAQLAQHPSTIGLDAQPTNAQARHWQEHLALNRKDSYCPWCVAQDMGIDTSESAYKRARAILREQRRAPTRTPYHHAGDGSVKVYQAAKSAKTAKPLITDTDPDFAAFMAGPPPALGDTAKPVTDLSELLAGPPTTTKEE